MKTKSSQLTRIQSQRIIRALVIGLVLLLSWYVISRFVRVVSGPSIVMFTATNIDEEYPAFIQLQGVTKNTKSLLVNDYPVAPATDGGFEYLFVAQPGVSTVTLTAFDKFDNQATKTLDLHTDEPPDNTRPTFTSQSTSDPDVESEESQQEVTNNL